MNFKTAIDTCLKQKYATFEGRASRSEYWYFALFIFIALFAISAVFLAIAYIISSPESQIFVFIIVVPILLFYIAILVPMLAVHVRRFHDINLSGWWVLGVYLSQAIPFVSFIVSIVNLVMLCKAGSVGANRFGNNPFSQDDYQKTFE